MKFHETPIRGAFLIEPEPFRDGRGFFARIYNQREFEQHGLIGTFVQTNNTFSHGKGTLRGLHYQLPPFTEAKFLRTIRGAVFDFIADIRPDSATFRKWWGAELTAENRLAMYAPPGTAHGILTLVEDTEVLFSVSAHYAPAEERGIRFDDPAFAIALPIEPVIVSDKDRQWPDFDPDFHGTEKLRGLM